MCASVLLGVASLALAAAPPKPAATTLDRIRSAGKIKIGYRTDARPFSFKDESGNPAGFSVALCTAVADAIKGELALPQLSVEWVPVTATDRFQVLKDGGIDLLCGADTETLGRRKDVAFSTPIFPGGIGALVRADAPPRLKEVLTGQKQAQQPQWRASASQFLQTQNFAVVSGTTTEDWLNKKLGDFQVTAKITPVGGYEAGVQSVLDRKTNVLFGDRAILLDAAARSATPGALVVLQHSYTFEPLAIGVARGDEDMRLVVDKTLSGLYSSGEIGTLYSKWFGKPDENALTFFRMNTRPE
jgi:ABC-type amino acid transport substrate-binding protein